MLAYKLDAQHLLTARRGNDVSLLRSTSGARPVGIRGQRPRAGLVRRVRVVGRDLYRRAKPCGFRHCCATTTVTGGAQGQDPQPLFVRLKQPDGKPFVDSRIEAGPHGYYRFEKTIPSMRRPGAGKSSSAPTPAGDGRAGHDFADRGIPAGTHETRSRQRRCRAQARPAAQAAGHRRLSVWSACRGNRFHRETGGRGRTAPPRATARLLLRRSDLELPKEAKDVIEATLDAQGKLHQDIALPAEVKPVSTIAAIVSGSVFESGGRSVNRSLKRVLWPADAIVGVRPLFDDKEGSNANAMQFRIVARRQRRQAASGERSEGDAGARASRLPLEPR